MYFHSFLRKRISGINNGLFYFMYVYWNSVYKYILNINLVQTLIHHRENYGQQDRSKVGTKKRQTLTRDSVRKLRGFCRRFFERKKYLPLPNREYCTDNFKHFIITVTLLRITKRWWYHHRTAKTNLVGLSL